MDQMDRDKPKDALEVLETFGRYHWLQYILVCLPSLVVTIVNINFIFIAADLDYRCKIPECEATNSSFHPHWWPNATLDKCSKPILYDDVQDVQIDGCTNTSFTDKVGKCDEWVYESNNTIVGELNLACQPWKINLIGTIHNIGMLFSMVIAGWMSDRFGRKPTMIFCATASAIGHLKAFAVSYYMYVTIEFFEAVVSGGIYLSTSVMLIEFGGKQNRVLAGVLLSYVVYFGESILAVIAIAVPYWKNLVRIIYTPPFIFLSYIFLVRESPRWQILNGKSEQAKCTIKTIAKANKIRIDEEGLKNLDDNKLRLLFNIKNYEIREGYKDIFNSREILKRLLVASVGRFTCGFVYYGLMINSVLLPGNKYTNFLLSTVMSYPGELMALFLMNKVGRRLPLIWGFLICGTMCIGSGYLVATWAKITFFLIGKMLISACFTGMITYTMELYPTSTRASLLSFGSVTSRLGAMLAPLTPMLLPLSPVLPSIFFGGFSLLSALLLTLTPETRDLPLMDTIEQVNAIAKNDRIMKKQAKLEQSSVPETELAKHQSTDTVVTKV